MANPISGTLLANPKLKNLGGSPANSFLHFLPEDFCTDPAYTWAFVTCLGTQNFTTIAAASNGLTLPQSVIALASTNNMPTAGTIQINISGVINTVQYTGIVSNTLTGCTGGTGTLATGNQVSSPGTVLFVTLATATTQTSPYYQDQTGTVQGWFGCFYDPALNVLIAMDQVGNMWEISLSGSPPTVGSATQLTSSPIANLGVNQTCTFFYDIVTGYVWAANKNSHAIYGFSYSGQSVVDQGGQFVAVTHPFTRYGAVTTNYMMPGGGLAISEQSGITGSVIGATNATPIVVQTSGAHGLQNGATVQIAGVNGNTAANGYWIATAIDSTHLQLNGSVGNSAYTSGGTWTQYIQWVAIANQSYPCVNEFTSQFYSDSIISDASGACNSTSNGATPGVAIPWGTQSQGGAISYDTASPTPRLYAHTIVGSTRTLFKHETNRAVSQIATTATPSGLPVLKMIYMPSGGYTVTGTAGQITVLNSSDIQIFD